MIEIQDLRMGIDMAARRENWRMGTAVGQHYDSTFDVAELY